MGTQLTVNVDHFMGIMDEYDLPLELSSIILLTYVLYCIELLDTKKESTYLPQSYKEIIGNTIDTVAFAKPLHRLYTDERLVPDMRRRVEKGMLGREELILKGTLADWLVTPDNHMLITFLPNVDL